MEKEEFFYIYNKIKNKEINLSELDYMTLYRVNKMLLEEIDFLEIK